MGIVYGCRSVGVGFSGMRGEITGHYTYIHTHTYISLPQILSPCFISVLFGSWTSLRKKVPKLLENARHRTGTSIARRETLSGRVSRVTSAPSLSPIVVGSDFNAQVGLSWSSSICDFTSTSFSFFLLPSFLYLPFLFLLLFLFLPPFPFLLLTFLYFFISILFALFLSHLHHQNSHQSFSPPPPLSYSSSS